MPTVLPRLRSPGKRDGEEGFTLIELLVVIIIIGILAAIAIPTYLSQRSRGYDAAAKSDLRNLAGFEEIYLNDTNGYGTLAQILALEPTLNASKGVTLSVVRYDAQFGYCLSAVHPGSGHVWYFDSQAGGLLPKSAVGCTVTTTGTPGDSITG